MMKLNFADGCVEIVVYTGAGPAIAKIEYGKDFDELRKVPLPQLQRLGTLLTLALSTLTYQDAAAQLKAARTEMEAIDGPKIEVPDKKLLVPA